MVVHAINASTWEVEVGELKVQGYPCQHRESEASLDYNETPCLRVPITYDKTP